MSSEKAKLPWVTTPEVKARAEVHSQLNHRIQDLHEKCIAGKEDHLRQALKHIDWLDATSRKIEGNLIELKCSVHFSEALADVDEPEYGNKPETSKEQQRLLRLIDQGLAVLKSEVEDAASEIKDPEKYNLQVEIKNLKKKLDDTELEIDGVNQLGWEIQGECDVLRADKNSLQANIENLQTDNEDLRADNEDLQTNNEDLRALQVDLCQELANVRTTTTELQNDIDTLVAENTILEKKWMTMVM
jgi:chromosome segregation ATPase